MLGFFVQGLCPGVYVRGVYVLPIVKQVLRESEGVQLGRVRL